MQTRRNKRESAYDRNHTDQADRPTFAPDRIQGYDRKATDGLFDELKTYVTTLLSEHGAAQARVAELEKQLPAAQEKEKEITEALLVASRVRGESEHEGKELRAKYEREAEARLKAAAAEAEKILNEAKSRAHAFEEEARDAEQLGVRRENTSPPSWSRC